MSAYHQHEFTWEGEAQEVIVTGTFDNWGSTVCLMRKGQTWAAKCDLPFGTKVLYKFVVDGAWQHSNAEPTEHDSSGMINNVLETPQLYYPSIPLSVPLHFSRPSRNIQVVQWEEDLQRLVALAGAHSNSSLTFNLFRRMLDLVLGIESGFRFGLLAKPEQGDEYDVEVTPEGKNGSSSVEEGFYLLLQPESAPPPNLPPTPHLFQSQFITAPSSSSSSVASFSTARSTNFSYSVLGSATDRDQDFVCVVDLASVLEVGEMGMERVRKAVLGNRLVFDPENSFQPISLHPTADVYLTTVRYKAPSTTLEKSEIEEWLASHFLESLNVVVKGGGKDVEDDDEDEDSDGWGEEVVVG